MLSQRYKELTKENTHIHIAQKQNKMNVKGTRKPYKIKIWALKFKDKQQNRQS